MKIGTLTFHRACNYGGALQCYALVHFLRKNGYDAEVIDYPSKAIDCAYKLVKTTSLRKFVGSLLRMKYTYKANRNFRNFRERYIPISRKIYNAPNGLGNDYDVVLIGSDQVWSKRINKGFDPFFWGVLPSVKRVISYAASMGTDHCFTKEENAQIASYLNNFNSISVREDSLAKELKSLTPKHIDTVIDPTLLLDLDEYIELAQMPQDSDYVLYYQMEYHPDSKYRVQEVAKELGCHVVVIGGKKEKYDVPVHFFNASALSPTEFVGYFIKAKCVFSSSFHGTALSIAMRKDFYFFANYETDRAANLLKYVGALDRMIPSTNPLSFSKVNYDAILPRLNYFREKSVGFLISNLDNVHTEDEK